MTASAWPTQPCCGRLCRDRYAGRCRSGAAQHLPYSRKGVGKTLFRAGPPAQDEDARAADGKELTIGVAGCVAQAEGQEILRRAPNVDLVIGPQTYHRLPNALARVRGGEKVVETDYAIEDKFEHLPAPRREETRKARRFRLPHRAG